MVGKTDKESVEERRSFGKSALFVMSILFAGTAMAFTIYGLAFDLNTFYSSGPLYGIAYVCDRASR